MSAQIVHLLNFCSRNAYSAFSGGILTKEIALANHTGKLPPRRTFHPGRHPQPLCSHTDHSHREICAFGTTLCDALKLVFRINKLAP